MQDLKQILIPIVAIASVFSIPIIAIVYHFRQKNREMDERALYDREGNHASSIRKSKEEKFTFQDYGKWT